MINMTSKIEFMKSVILAEVGYSQNTATFTAFWFGRDTANISQPLLSL